LAEDSSGLVDCAGNEGGIFAMRCVVVASVEYSEGLVGDGGKGLIEADKTYFVVDLEFQSAIGNEEAFNA
jgi:hypothetical protein